MRMIKRIFALLLWPFCLAATRALLTLLDLVPVSFGDKIPMDALGFLIGFGLWLFAYSVMPRPMRTYVLGHELTHALWGWAMGARIKGIKVSARGGHVRLTRTNFLITLAPYFFPFYTVLVLALHFILSLFWDMSLYQPVWMGWVGLTWAFHLTFTFSILRIKQPDVQEHGRLFSYTIIYLFNVLGLSMGLWALLDMEWSVWSLTLWEKVYQDYTALWHLVVAVFERGYAR